MVSLTKKNMNKTNPEYTSTDIDIYSSVLFLGEVHDTSLFIMFFFSDEILWTVDANSTNQDPHYSVQHLATSLKLLLILLLLFYSLEFFTSALADDLSLEFLWQKVSSSILDSS